MNNGLAKGFVVLVWGTVLLILATTAYKKFSDSIENMNTNFKFKTQDEMMDR